MVAVVAIAALVFALWPKGKSESAEIDRRLGVDDRGKRDTSAEARRLVKSQSPTLVDTFKSMAPRIAAPLSDEDQSKLKQRLLSGGFRSETAPLVFLASKTVLGVVVAGITFFLTWKAHHRPLNVFGLTAGIGMGAFMLPNVWLSLAIGDRMKKIKKGLADALDLMVIMVESGLGMDAAIQRVGTEMNEAYPQLAEEFRICNAEINMGLKRSEALESLGNRTGIPEIRSLASTIVQAERFGTSVGKTLRAQSDMLRMKRQQAAEEAAAKTAVKLLIPLVLFIFPALMIVVGGPAMMGILESFSKVEK